MNAFGGPNWHDVTLTDRDVRAVLAGRKTSLRLVMRPQPVRREDGVWWWACAPARAMMEIDEEVNFHGGACFGPLGYRGDKLRVREAWQCWVHDGGHNVSWREADIAMRVKERVARIAYRASNPSASDKWLSPLRMPAWASRLTLDIASVRAERLSAVDEEGALREGATASAYRSARFDFACRWDARRRDARDRWEADPFVWHATFRVASPDVGSAG